MHHSVCLLYTCAPGLQVCAQQLFVDGAVHGAVDPRLGLFLEFLGAQAADILRIDGDASYQDLVAKGYLTEAVLNYICLLGWSPRGEYAEQEIFSLPELCLLYTSRCV